MNKQYLKDYKDHAFSVPKAELTFTLEPEATLVTSKLNIKRRHGDVIDCELYGENVELNSIKLNGVLLDEKAYEVNPQSLKLLSPPDEFVLELQTIISPIKNKALSGLYMSNGNFCTQCESHGFRRITYFIDRPDNMSEFTTHLIADKKAFPILLGNGNCIAKKDLGDKHLATWYDPSLKPSYLFAIVAGNFESLHDTYTTSTGEEVRLGVYVEPGKISQASFAMEALKLAMKWDEDKFDRVYDLHDYNIVGVSDFNFGAMENKGLNIFNTACMLANPETSTDADYVHVLGVIGHEYFHNWTGNRITLRNWFQLSLKEGLTVYRDQEFTADLTERVVKRIHDVHVLRTHQFAEDAGPMAHPVRPPSYVSMNNFYTTTVYNKGAEVVRMLETIIGVDGFKKGMQCYFDRHDGQAVTTDDFVQAHADANDINLEQFKRWYDQSGTPIVKVNIDHNHKEGIYKCTFTQVLDKQKASEPFLIPLKIGFVGDDSPIVSDASKVIQRGNDYILILDDWVNEFVFENIQQTPTLSLNRGFSSPVIIDYQTDDEDLIKTIGKDTDLFNRWDAIQQLSKKTILNWLTLGEASERVLSDTLIDAFKSLLIDHKNHGGFISVCMAPITARSILEKVPGTDILTIKKVCDQFYQQLSISCYDEFLKLYDGTVLNSNQSFDYKAMSARARKHVALLYLAKAKGSTSEALSYYQAASNMSERMGALITLNQQPSEARSQCLDDFKNKFENDALVMNKWFALQASITDDSVHSIVRSLMDNKLFNIENPNDVRALIGAYVSNPNFHDLDYDNYTWLTDLILSMDQFNPQMAARFVQPFLHHRLYDTERSDIMKKCLIRLVSEAKSDDVKEVAERGCTT